MFLCIFFSFLLLHLFSQQIFPCLFFSTKKNRLFFRKIVNKILGTRQSPCCNLPSCQTSLKLIISTSPWWLLQLSREICICDFGNIGRRETGVPLPLLHALRLTPSPFIFPLLLPWPMNLSILREISTFYTKFIPVLIDHPVQNFPGIFQCTFNV